MNKIGKKISATLVNGYWFQGVVIDETKHKIIISDINGERVELNRNTIIALREMDE